MEMAKAPVFRPELLKCGLFSGVDGSLLPILAQTLKAQGAVHLAKVEPHYVSVHISYKVEVAPREFEALAECLAGRAIESPCHAHDV